MNESSELQSAPPSDSLLLAAKTLALVAFAIVGYGVFVAYTYREIDKVVGGDAFNFIILALRGLIWVGIGGIVALFSAVCFILGTRR